MTVTERLGFISRHDWVSRRYDVHVCSGCTQHSVQWILGSAARAPSVVEVKNACGFTTAPLCALMALGLDAEKN